jgi:aspartate-semialdehyde dehydrogenase
MTRRSPSSEPPARSDAPCSRSSSSGSSRSELRLFASARSAGGTVDTAWGTVEIEDLATADPAGVEIALFSAGGDRSKQYAPAFAAAGAVVVDNSSAFRMDTDVPLVVAHVNDHAVADRPRGIIANPNCTTMDLMMAAGPLHRAAGLRAMVATSYQSVSGSGNEGHRRADPPDRLLPAHPRGPAGGRVGRPRFRGVPAPIGFNVIPFAGAEKDRATPTRNGSWSTRPARSSRRPDPGRADLCPGPRDGGPRHRRHHVLRPSHRPGRGLEACWRRHRASRCGRTPRPPRSTRPASTTSWWVASVRRSARQGGINLWVVGDNLRKGAALNAVQIAELVLA